MPDTKHFDPVGWFLSTCIALLIGAIALSIAVHLVQSVWPWLFAGLVVVGVLIALVRLAIWWRGGQTW